MTITKVRNHGQVRWRVALVLRGREVRRFFKARPDALRWAKRQEQAAFSGSAWLGLSPVERDELLAARARLKAAGISVPEAVSLALKHAASGAVPVVEAVNACLESKQQAGLSTRYLEQLGFMLRGFAKSFVNCRLRDVKPDSLIAWSSGDNLAPSTRLTRLRAIQTLWAFCLRQGWVAEDLTQRVDRPKVVPPPPKILSVREARRLMRAAQAVEPSTCGWLALALFCGIRPAEIHRLSPGSVRLDQHLVEVGAAQSKTSSRRLVDIPPNARRWLRLSTIPVLNLRRKLWRVRDAAGVVWSQDVLRHSAASYCLAWTQDAARTALLMGHSPAVLQRHYRALVTRREARRFYCIVPRRAVTKSG